MIKTLEIQNFQSHASSELIFHPGVNVIIGSSDSGKTAIIRALRWVIWNRPSGDSIQSHWGGETLVKITTEDAIQITRIKGKGDRYISHVTGEEDMEFKAFGTSVPEEINNFLNLNEINIQRQLDAPFLLSETSGEIAKHFNKIAKLDKIDTSMSFIKREMTTISSTMAYTEKNITNVEQELKKYDGIEQIEVQIEVLESVKKRRDSLQNNHTKLLKLIGDIEANEEVLATYNKTLALEKPLNKVLATMEEKKKEITKRQNLDRILTLVLDNEREKEELSSSILVEGRVDTLLGIFKERGVEVTLYLSLETWMTRFNKIQDNIAKTTLIRDTLQEKMDALNICPFCGSKLK